MRTVSYEFGRSLPIEVQLLLWRYFIFGYEVNLGDRVTNPLRPDKHPNCWLHINGENKIELNDFGLRDHIKSYSENGISLYDSIKWKYNLNSYNSVDKLIHEYLLEENIEFTLVKSPSIEVNKTKLSYNKLRVKDKIAYSKNVVEYYETYGITCADLYNSKVFCVESFSLSKIDKGEQKSFTIKPFPEVCVALELQDNRVKIYFPLRKENKWYGNATSSNYWLNTNNKNKEVLVICTSHKDALVVHNITGYDTYAPISETNNYSEEQIQIITSYPRVFTLGDGDFAGDKFNKRNNQLFNAIIVDIKQYSAYENKYGKSTKDISEIYRHDKELCYSILNEISRN